MNCFCFWFQRFCFFSLISVVPASFLGGQSIPKDKAKQLETLVTHASGVLSDIPEEIRALRVGPVSQRVSVSEDGLLTLSRSFYCTPFFGQAGAGKQVKATSVKKCALGNLKDKNVRRFEINRHVNTIQLFDREEVWPLSFSSTADAERAFALISSLIASAPPASAISPVSPSEIAAHAGFRYLVVTFRCAEVADGVRLLSMPDPSPRLLCWLTKQSPQQENALCAESFNRLPLFLFDLSILDQCPFFTQSIPGASAFLPCSIGKDICQSVYSDDKNGLESFMKSSAFVGICFQAVPNFASPVAIVCKKNDEHSIRKGAKSTGLSVKEAAWFCTPGLNPVEREILQRTPSSWITGLSDSSYDILRYCLFSKELTPVLFAHVLYPEFPSLKKLLTQRSSYQKNLSLEEMICGASQMLDAKVKTLSEFQQRVLRLALATHELGSPFGADADLGYNSWPLCLAMAEKVGLTEQEIAALHALIDDACDRLLLKADKKKKAALILFLAQESQTANEIGICLGEWLQLKACFYEILSRQGKLREVRQENALRVKLLQKKYSSILPFGIPRGLLFCKGPLKTRGLYSSYVWEERDPQHRDGLCLKRRREKFEQSVIDGSKAGLKGHFWEYLRKELQNDALSPNRYLNDNEREEYRAVFEDGVLVAPKLPQSDDEIEMMFVVDDWGRMYIGEKKEGDEHLSGFNHASFLGGRPVASAGTLIFKDRKPIQLSDHSGHYRCGPHEREVAMRILEKMGVSVGDVKVSTTDNSHSH